MIAVRTIDIVKDFKRVAEQVNQGQRVLISRPRNENFVLMTEKEYNEIEKYRQAAALDNLRAALEATQVDSVLNGADNLTIDDINAIIAEVRDEKREEPCEM